MKPFAVGCLVVGLLVVRADAANRIDELFASWQTAQRDVKSLVVDFTLKRRNVFGKQEAIQGTFRLIRTTQGAVFASYEVTLPNSSHEKQRRESGLLSNGTVYWLNHDKKTAFRFEPTDGDLQGFLEKYFNPYVRLLDRKRAEAMCHLEIVEQDESHTYLSVKQKEAKRPGWFPGVHCERGIVLMNHDSEHLPKDMPWQLWLGDDFQQLIFEIKSWQLNTADPPQLEEFTRPEDRPGWEVSDWPYFKRK